MWPMMLLPRRERIQRPSYRLNGQYQFVVGYTGGGAEECVHLTMQEITERAIAKLGPGSVADDGVDLWWTADNSTSSGHKHGELTT